MPQLHHAIDSPKRVALPGWIQTIGLIGGMSWQSSALYYRIINEETAPRLGGFHNARSLLSTVDFADVESLQHEGLRKKLGAILANVAKQLERGGADLLVFASKRCIKGPKELREQ